jgi:hypothetical protein
MRTELDELLCTRYPEMMVNRNLAMTETCMCWGFECGDGWFNILDQLMGSIQHYINGKNRRITLVTQVTLDQVKEKFGTLRFYYTGGDDVVHGMVRVAEGMSAVTCETCGAPGIRGGDGWIKTSCSLHRDNDD